MSDKKHKVLDEISSEQIITESSKDETNYIESDCSDEKIVDTDPRDEKIANLEFNLAELKNRERDNILRAKAEMENLRRRTEQDIEKAHKFALEKFVNELLPVIDNLDRALEISDKSNLDLSSVIKGVELTLKSMLDVVRKFGVEVISNVNVPLDPNVHQAISIVESEEVIPGNVLTIMQKGYTLNGRTIRPAMVAVAKQKE